MENTDLLVDRIKSQVLLQREFLTDKIPMSLEQYKRQMDYIFKELVLNNIKTIDKFDIIYIQTVENSIEYNLVRSLFVSFLNN